MIDLNQKVSEVVQITKHIGYYIFEEAQKFSHEKIEFKGKNDLVSYVDKEAEKKFVNSLHDILPEAGFIAEEGTSTKKGERYNWVIDPVDGTTNFTHGLPIYSSSIALMEGEEVLLGVVNDITKDQCYFATRDSKAYRDGDEINVSPVKDLNMGLISTGYPYSAIDKLPVFFEIFNELMRDTHGVRRLGSAALDLVYVACGYFEGFFEFKLSPWDMAAGALIVERAGGKVTDFKGGDNVIFGQQIVAGCAVQPQLLEIVSKHWH